MHFPDITTSFYCKLKVNGCSCFCFVFYENVAKLIEEVPTGREQRVGGGP